MMMIMRVMMMMMIMKLMQIFSTLSNTSQDLREQADHVQQSLTNRFLLLFILIKIMIMQYFQLKLSLSSGKNAVNVFSKVKWTIYEND